MLSRWPVGQGDPDAPPGPDMVWAFPLIGAGHGLIAGATGAVALWLGLTPFAAAVLALAALAASTGMLHEDGLADCADGFHGGHTPERRLAIMKDSRLGTYGALTLMLATLLKLAALAALPLQAWIPALMLAGAGSRAAILWPMARMDQARPGGLSAGFGLPSGRSIAVAFALAGAVAILMGGRAGLPMLAIGCLATLPVQIRARRLIGGQTGDVLGAAQQWAEIAILLTAALLWG
ncbi:adenosylcobinamide-GDP ribazoletransferase [Rhodobacteraceae bacterium KN286]|uniref:Adenosylcobinamide-GDP ribazoletransferase n=2 Tax=Oceanomicrobium pacificus TaxID=2692916 RepID=A0A6B0THG7_9RHOB|nr:adenosylcobinamide-GDP ribazoletransferase [Oceanomicrobium pacificus]